MADLKTCICALIKLSWGSRWGEKKDNIFQQPKKDNTELELNSF